jgi:predicted RNA-binding Zn-ribbon protein involved in translation (DUF1610 family)
MSDATDGDGDGDLAVERLPPEEAFGLLAHETRLHVLRALDDADGPLAFSALHDRVDLRDSGGFNYHLEKLVGRFVRETDEGYDLAEPGRRVVGAVLSGGVTKALAPGTVPVDGDCPNCGTPMEARLRSDGVTIGCDDCDWNYTDPAVPAGLLEGWSREAIPEVVDRYVRRNLRSMDSRLCDYCDGRVDRDLLLHTDEDAPEWLVDGEAEAVAVYACRRCGRRIDAMPAFALLPSPAVVAFYHDHGLDATAAPGWELTLDGVSSTLASTDPVRLEVTYPAGGERLVLLVDGDLSVLEERREPA